MNNVDKWRIARYLIDAKKDVDSISFIAWNEKELNIDTKKEVEKIKNDFYINCACIIDKFVENQPLSNNKKREFKKEIENNNDVINDIFYQRDKHSAHKDFDYKPKKFNSLFEIVIELQRQLRFVKNFCSEVLPDNITLDFVSYDRSLFRNLHHITKEKEEQILKRKHPEFVDLETAKRDLEDLMPGKIKFFEDTEDLPLIDKPEEYAVVVDYGLTCDEGLQNRQDFCIRANVIYGLDTWCKYSYKNRRLRNLGKSLGYYTIFDEFIEPDLKNPKVQQDMKFIENFMKLNV